MSRVQPSDYLHDLTPRQRAAVLLLSQGLKSREVAAELKVSERTISEYRRNPLVKRAIQFYQEETLRASGGRSVDLMPRIIRTLEQIMSDNGNPQAQPPTPGSSDRDKIAACRVLLGAIEKHTERELLMAQIEKLEQMLEAVATGRPFEAPGTVTALPPCEVDPLLKSASPEDDL